MYVVTAQVENEAALRHIFDTANQMLGSRDILDDLAEEQRVAWMEICEPRRWENCLTLHKVKKRMGQSGHPL